MKTNIVSTIGAAVMHHFRVHGSSINKLAKTFNVSRRTIGRIFREHGHPPCQVQLSADEAIVVDMMRAGKANASKIIRAIRSLNNSRSKGKAVNAAG